MKQLPNEISEQELINLLQDKEVKEIVQADDNHTPLPIQFLMVFNITPGKFTIKTSTLHKLFKQWKPNSKMSLKSFSGIVKDYIPGNKRSCLLINEKDIKLSQKIFHHITQNKKVHPSTKLLKQHMDKYLYDNGLMRGTDWYPAKLLHEEYWIWCYKSKKSKRVTFTNFINVMKLYFEVKRNQHNEIVVGINSAQKEEKTNTPKQK